MAMDAPLIVSLIGILWIGVELANEGNEDWGYISYVSFFDFVVGKR